MSVDQLFFGKLTVSAAVYTVGFVIDENELSRSAFIKTVDHALDQNALFAQLGTKRIILGKERGGKHRMKPKLAVDPFRRKKLVEQRRGGKALQLVYANKLGLVGARKR